MKVSKIKTSFKASQLWHNVEEKPIDFATKVDKHLMQEYKTLIYSSQHGIERVERPLTCKVWAPKILEILYKFTGRKIDEECRPKRFSWVAYNALGREKSEGGFAPQLLDASLSSFMGKNGQHLPLN